MFRTVTCVCLIVFGLTVEEGFPRNRTLTDEERSRLKEANTVLVHAVALTERGSADPQDIQQVVRRRLQELGYTAHDNPNAPYDVLVKIKCEERKTPLIPSHYGGDADSRYASSRNWRGPACQITYGLDGHDTAWRKEIRAPFANARQAARAARVKNSGQYALAALSEVLAADDFPYLLTAEWRQAARLSKVMEKSKTPRSRKLKIISLLGQIAEPETIPTLERALQDPSLATSAAVAIGRQGDRATGVLLQVLRTAQDTNLKVAAVKGLGEIATHSSQAPVLTPFLSVLNEPSTELPVQTEIVIALGKLADRRAVEPLTKLNWQAWNDPSRDPDIQKLRDALSWSLWQLNPDAHAGE